MRSARHNLLCMTILATGWSVAADAQDTTGGPAAAAPPAALDAKRDTPDTTVNPQDIVVTATRQGQALSKVPLSIQAFTPKQMDEQGVRRIDDIATLTPGLSFQRSTYGNGSLSDIAIRGINSTVGAATTGIYIDDTPIQVRQLGFTATNPYPEVFDLDRVEVIRGPQGTLFGAGAEGGAVRFITPSPSLDKYEGYARSELSFTEHGAPSYEGGGALGGPIVDDKIGFRVSAWYRRDGGYVDRSDYSGNVLDKNSNSQDSLVLRGALTFQPSDDLKITPSVYYQRVHIDDSSALWQNLSAGKSYKDASSIAQPSVDRFILPSLNVTYSNDDISVISVSSYFRRSSRMVLNYTAFTNGTFAFNSVPFIPGYLSTAQMNNSQRNFNQEVRIQSSNPDAPLKWVLGGFYSNQHQHSYDQTVDPFFADLISAITGGMATVEQFTGSPVLPGNVTYLNINQGKDTQLAGFAQVDWRLFDKLTLTGGVRVSRSTFGFVTDQAGPGAGTLSFHYSGKQKETPVTPRFGVNFQATPDTLLYATAAKGFRDGGANSPVNPVQCGSNLAALGLTQSPASYNSDSLWSYEAGAKGRAVDNVLQYEASGYYIKWRNIQQEVYLPLCGEGFVNNDGAASSRGFDLQVQLRLSSAWTMGLTTGYVDARYDQTVASGLGSNYVTRGDRLPGSPWTLDVSLRGEFGLGTRRFYVRGDYAHQSAYANNLTSQDPANGAYDPGATPDQQSNDLSLRLGTHISGVDVSLFVTNLLDQEPVFARAHNSVNDPIYTFVTDRPRTAGITGTYRF